MSGPLASATARGNAVFGAVFLAILALMVLATVEAYKLPDYGAYVVQKDGQWIVVAVDQESIAARAGLQPGDVLVALDTVPPGARRATDPGLDLGTAQAWSITRQGSDLTLQLAEVQGDGPVSAIPGVFLVVALSFWAVGGYVRLRKPQDELALQFSLFSVAVAMALTMSSAAGRDVVCAKVLEVVAFALLPSLFLGFVLRLARGPALTGLDTLAERLLRIAGILVGGLYLVLALLGSEHYETVRVILLVLLAGAFLAGLMVLVRACLRPRSPSTRQQIGVVLLGTALAGAPLTMLSLIPESLGMSSLIHPQIAALSTVLLPISFGYAVLRRRLLNMDVVIERTLVHGLMVLLIAGCYGLLLYVMSLTMHGAETDEGQFALLAFVIAATLTFVPVQDRIRRLVDQLIYRDRYDYGRVLLTLGNKLTSLRPIDEVLSSVAYDLAEVMNLEGVALFIRQSDGELAPRGACGKYAQPAQLASLAASAAAWRSGADGQVSAGYWVPLAAHGTESGLLCLGPKRSGARFRAEDLSLASTVASQTAVAIANSLLVERLHAKVAELELLGDRLLHVQGDERKRLARDLHDGALQSVIELVRQAESVAESLPEGHSSTDHVLERLSGLVERGRDAAHELRMVCSDLYPSELAHLGLVAALESLTRRISRDEDLEVRLSTERFPQEQRLPEDVEDALYHVAREALDNACRHAAAGVAEVICCLEDGQVTVQIRDDGCGFIVPVSAGALLRTGHLGLTSMRERIERLGGEFGVVSAPGQGTEIVARMSVAHLATAQGAIDTQAVVQ